MEKMTAIFHAFFHDNLGELVITSIKVRKTQLVMLKTICSHLSGFHRSSDHTATVTTHHCEYTTCHHSNLSQQQVLLWQHSVDSMPSPLGILQLSNPYLVFLVKRLSKQNLENITKIICWNHRKGNL